MSDTEKEIDSKAEGVEDVNAHDELQFSAEEERKLVRRLDWRLIGACGMGYSISLMDRSNVGMAAITGMLVDLDLAPSLYVRAGHYCDSN
jgi:hypothetical protein